MSEKEQSSTFEFELNYLKVVFMKIVMRTPGIAQQCIRLMI